MKKDYPTDALTRVIIYGLNLKSLESSARALKHSGVDGVDFVVRRHIDRTREGLTVGDFGAGSNRASTTSANQQPGITERWRTFVLRERWLRAKISLPPSGTPPRSSYVFGPAGYY